MPEQSAGGSLTPSVPSPRVEHPGPGARGGLATSSDLPAAGLQATGLQGTVDRWRRALAGSGLPDTLLVSGPGATSTWLDLTHAHPSGLAQLFAARPTRLSSLFRESAAHTSAMRQARAIRASAIAVSAQRGVHGCCLAVGVATWRPRSAETAAEVLAPIVLRGCTIRPRGDEEDFDLDLDDAVLINPELVRELVEGYGIEADGAHLAALTHGEKGFDPRPVYAWLEERCRSLRAFSVQRSLVLATFAAGSGAVLSDLDAAVPAIARHRLLRRVAEASGVTDLVALEKSTGPDGESSPVPSLAAGAPAGESRRLAVVGRLGPRTPRPIRPPAEPDPARELLVVDCDPQQEAALEAVLRGEDVVIEGPPGSGVTHTLVAAVAGLVAAGRRVLVLSPRPGSSETLLARLQAAGVGNLVLDLRDDAGRSGGRAGSASRLREALDSISGGGAPGGGADDESVAAVRRARELLDGEVTALHEVRPPWGVSAYDAMVSLAELTGRVGAPSGSVRLPEAVLGGLDAATRERLRVHLHAAATAGAFTLTQVDTRWYDADVSTAAGARVALEAAIVLRAGLERARTTMTTVTQAAGLRLASNATGWLPVLELLTGVRTVLDSMQPHLYEQPLVELAGAVAPRQLRGKEPTGRSERRRLRRQAQALVRPGVHVPDLYQVLLTAAEQRLRWRVMSLTGETPRVVAGLTDAEAAVRRVMTAIDVLDGVLSGPGLREIPLDELEQRVFDLAGDTQGILGQPRRATLIEGLRRAGLGEVVDDLRTRRVGPDQIDAEFDLTWWSSVRDSIVRSDPRLGRHDAETLRAAGRDLRTAETARVEGGAALVRSRVSARASSVAAAHDGQVQILRQELSRAESRFRMVDLVRRCGDVLSALAPIWMMSPETVASCLVPADPAGAPIVDAVVVDDAGHIGLPEVVAALARGAQLIVGGDLARLSPPSGSASVIGELAPFATVYRLERDHRTRDGRLLVPLAPRYPSGWQLTPGTDAQVAFSLEPVPEGVAIPAPGEELPISSDAEVLRVLDLVERHVLRRPAESLAVVTLSERHAERIEEALRTSVDDRPMLAAWLDSHWRSSHSFDDPEPFAVRPVTRSLGLERDATIVSIGLARTPHGRVLHRFGVLDGAKGAAALTTALSRARNRTTVVCCFTADDLNVDRLRTPGSRLLRDVLLFAGGRVSSGARRAPAADGLVTDLRDRLAAAGLPVQLRMDDGSWPLDIAVADPRVPGRMLVAVDVDGPSFASQTCRERERSRPSRWERAGWAYQKISALDLFADPALEVARIRSAFDEAMTHPLPPDAYPLPLDLGGPVSSLVPASPLVPASLVSSASSLTQASLVSPTSSLGPVSSLIAPASTFDVVEGEIDPVELTDDPVEPTADPPVRSDIVDAEVIGTGPEDDDDPVIPDRADDDRDEGWGDRERGSRDDELERDRPPHWE